MPTFNISLTKSERYGYVTNTKIKFVVVVESANTALRDNEIRTVSDGIIYLYVKLFLDYILQSNFH